MNTMKLAILDKDNTLVQPKLGAQFVQAPDDQELIPGVKEAIAVLVADGYTLVIASNQGGVAAGHKSLEIAIAEMRYCLKLLPEISYALFCPDFAGEECWVVTEHGCECLTNAKQNFRKPNPGMLRFAIHSFGGYVSLTDRDANSCFLMIGDRDEDHQAAVAAKIPFIHAEAWRKGSVLYL